MIVPKLTYEINLDSVEQWIETNYPCKAGCINNCQSTTSDIVTQFPFLDICVGVANGRYHCWSEYEGQIFDPTRKQFDGKISYRKMGNGFVKKDNFDTAVGAIHADEIGD